MLLVLLWGFAFSLLLPLTFSPFSQALSAHPLKLLDFSLSSPSSHPSLPSFPTLPSFLFVLPLFSFFSPLSSFSTFTPITRCKIMTEMQKKIKLKDQTLRDANEREERRINYLCSHLIIANSRPLPNFPFEADVIEKLDLFRV